MDLSDNICRPSRSHADAFVVELKATLVNFAMDHTVGHCGITEIDMGGQVTSAAYRLDTLFSGVKLGEMIKQPQTWRIDRKSWNPALPDGGIESKLRVRT